jgi:SulP family sulfate permease
LEVKALIYKFLPGLNFLSNYKRGDLTGDLTAGTIVAILFIPQSMAYAIIAGVPPVLGLYAGTFPLVVYALFGTSKHLSVGPVSIVSLLAFSGVAELAEPFSLPFIELIVTFGVMVGVIQLILRVVHVGHLFDHISPAVIGGFTSAAAIVIALNQVESIIGVDLSSYKQIVQFLLEVLNQLPQTNLYSAGIGVGSIVLLILLKRLFKLSPGPFIVVIISTLAVHYFQLHTKGVHIVGDVPKGLPQFTIPSLSFQHFQFLLPIAFSIAFISFLESYAVAKAVAEKEKNQLNTNQELTGLGLANITSSFVGSIPVAGAFSRTAVNYQSGAKTNVSSFITVLIIFITLLFFTPLFYYLPKAALAAIIIVAVLGLIDFKQFIFLAKTAPLDFILFMATFVTTLWIGIFTGLLIGIILSILLYGSKRVLHL